MGARARVAALLIGALICATAPALAVGDVMCEQPPDDGRCERWLARYVSPGGPGRGESTVTSPDGTVVYVTGRSAGEGSGYDYATLAYDADTGAELWVARFDGGGNDLPIAVGVSPDGGTVLVTGTATGALATIAYDAGTGEERWARFYAGPGGSDEARGLAVGLDGTRVYVTGYSAGPSPNNLDFATVAYDVASGAQRWVARYDGPAGWWDVVTDIGVGAAPGGERVYVTGRSNGESSANQHADFATVAYDGSTGEELWVARYDGPARDRDLPYALAVSPDGASVFVTGESVGAGTAFDYATVAYDAATGAERWVARYDHARADDRALGVVVTDDAVFVTGYSAERPDITWFIDRAAATVAYDAVTGQQLWVARRTWPGGAAGSDIAVSPDGSGVYTSGLRGGLVVGVGVEALGVAAAYSGFLLLAHDAASGDELWLGGYGGVGNEDSAQAVTVGPDGRVFVTGGGQATVTLSYDPLTTAPGPPHPSAGSTIPRRDMLPRE